MRRLLALLTDMEILHLPTNCVITKAYFDTQGTDEIVFHDAEYKGNHISVCMSNTSGTLWIDLLQLTKPLQLRQIPKVDKGIKTLTFTKENILHFVDDVNDCNPIHRVSPYIVPGLLILENLWKYVVQDKSKVGIAVRFLSPMLAEDCVCIESQREGNILLGTLDDTTLFRARLYDEHKIM